MGSYAHGVILYGLIHDEETKDLFSHLLEKKKEDPVAFDALLKKYELSLDQIGKQEVDILTACYNEVTAQDMYYHEINPDLLKKTRKYSGNILLFLFEAGVMYIAQYRPQWYVLTYTS